MTEQEETRLINIENRREWQNISNVIYMLFDLLEYAKRNNKHLIKSAFPGEYISPADPESYYKTDFLQKDLRHCLSMLENNKWHIVNLKNHFKKHYIR